MLASRYPDVPSGPPQGLDARGHIWQKIWQMEFLTEMEATNVRGEHAEFLEHGFEVSR